MVHFLSGVEALTPAGSLAESRHVLYGTRGALGAILYEVKMRKVN